MCLKDEDELEEYERRKSLMSYAYTTDDISASLAAALQEETSLFEEGRIAYLTVRLPADVNIALMHQATNSIKSNEQNSLDPHYRQVLFENPHKMSNGWIHLNENPGLGLEISETALKKFGKLVYKNK